MTVEVTVVKSNKKTMMRLGGFMLTLCIMIGALGIYVNAAGVDLKEGNHEKWIDRIDLTGSDSAADFYDWLVENSDGDGKNDALIDPAHASNLDGSYVYIIKELKGTAEFSYQTGGNVSSAAKKAAEAAVLQATEPADDDQPILNAAFDAFERDHPEVFWLSGSRVFNTRTTYSYSYGGGSGSVDYQCCFYFALKSSTFDIRLKDLYPSVSSIKTAIAARDAAVDAIIGSMSAETDYDRIVYLNNWLTTNNCYNANISTATKNAWKCISALTGYAGNNKNAPVCEGYARALKVLCDKIDIPCVLVNGDALDNDGNAGAHMWNYVELDGAWYAVDVTWNDPTVYGVTKKASGYEREDYLLVGSKTLVSGNTSFSENHIIDNTASVGGTSFVNGPVLSENEYTLPIETGVKVNTYSAGVTYSAEEQIVTVTHSSACRVGYLKDGEYVTLTACQNPDGSYSFEVPEDVKSVLLIVIGDVDFDGDLDAEDNAVIARSLLPSSSDAYVPMGAEQCFAADVNGNGEINSADKILIARSYLDTTHPLHLPISW